MWQQLLLIGESEDFQLANSNTPNSTAIGDMVLFCIEQSIQINYA